MARRDPDVVSATMRQVRARDTGPEISLRKALWKRGLRYRLYDRSLPGNPDIVFPGSRVVVFVDGDFWHGNQWRQRGHRSLDEQFDGGSNAEYWVKKIQRNMIRDGDATRRLEYDGWCVVRIWESDLKRDLDKCVQRVEQAVRERVA